MDGNRAGLQPSKVAPIISEGTHAADERTWSNTKLRPPSLLRSNRPFPTESIKRGVDEFFNELSKAANRAKQR